jgi:hypothetical protein
MKGILNRHGPSKNTYRRWGSGSKPKHSRLPHDQANSLNSRRFQCSTWLMMLCLVLDVHTNTDGWFLFDRSCRLLPPFELRRMMDGFTKLLGEKYGRHSERTEGQIGTAQPGSLALRCGAPKEEWTLRKLCTCFYVRTHTDFAAKGVRAARAATNEDDAPRSTLLPPLPRARQVHFLSMSLHWTIPQLLLHYSQPFGDP